MNTAAEDFANRALEWCRFQGQKDGEFPVIDRKEDAEAWVAWRRYFEAKGMGSSVAMMEQRSNWTVPEKWPWEFDSSYTRIPGPASGRKRPEEPPEHREAVVERAAAAIAKIGAPGSMMLTKAEARTLPVGTIIEAGGRIVHTNGATETFEQFRIRAAKGKAA